MPEGERDVSSPTPEQIVSQRFPRALRGYSIRHVDDALDRAADRIEELEATAVEARVRAERAEAALAALRDAHDDVPDAPPPGLDTAAIDQVVAEVGALRDDLRTHLDTLASRADAFATRAAAPAPSRDDPETAGPAPGDRDRAGATAPPSRAGSLVRSDRWRRIRDAAEDAEGDRDGDPLR